MLGKPDTKWGEVGMMITMLEENVQVSEDELKTFCLDKIAKFKIPKEFVFVAELPYSAYGKVEKLKLKEKYLG